MHSQSSKNPRCSLFSWPDVCFSYLVSCSGTFLWPPGRPVDTSVDTSTLTYHCVDSWPAVTHVSTASVKPFILAHGSTACKKCDVFFCQMPANIICHVLGACWHNTVTTGVSGRIKPHFSYKKLYHLNFFHLIATATHNFKWEKNTIFN